LSKLASVVIVLISLVLPQSASAACGYDRVAVAGTTEEIADACLALEQVLRYFKETGFRPVPEVSISFENHVYIDMYLHSSEPAGREPVGESEVSGYYNFPRKELHVTSGRRNVLRERRPWGLEWNRSIAYSILQHELAHAIVAALLGPDYPKLAKVWHEFIAYAIQFDLMNPALKADVLANYPNARAFQFPESVNAIVYGADPDEFGVSAYLYAEANGGPGFIRQLLEKQVPFSLQEFEFLWVE